MPLPSPERFRVTPADLAACRQMIREGSKTFHMASLLLPERVREPARSLYAFCRVADDLVDKTSNPASAVELLEDRLDRIYRGYPVEHPADRAFADVAERFALPRALPAALIEGFAWDAEGRSYKDLSGVLAYSVRVAGTVGVMMSLIMGVRDSLAIARACDLGVAMQLTNIVRDVGEDARNGRVYLPLDWLIEAKVDVHALLSEPRHSPEVSLVIDRILAEANILYERATAGIAMLPFSCRPAITAASRLYAEIGRVLIRQGRDSISRRAIVASRHKLLLLATAIITAPALRQRSDSSVLREAQFLIDAVRAAPAAKLAPRGIDERAAWLVDLFIRLDSQKS